MFILGIETTCDETGMALIEIKEDKVRILKNELASQIKIHTPYGGIVPILAAREHQKNLPFLLKNLEKDFDLKKIDYLAFSVGFRWSWTFTCFSHRKRICSKFG